MSMGPGKWQQLILDTLRDYPAFYVHDLLPRDAPRSHRIALSRAVQALAAYRKIKIIRRGCPPDMRNSVTVMRPGLHVDYIDVPRINVDVSPRRGNDNT